MARGLRLLRAKSEEIPKSVKLLQPWTRHRPRWYPTWAIANCRRLADELAVHVRRFITKFRSMQRVAMQQRRRCLAWVRHVTQSQLWRRKHQVSRRKLISDSRGTQTFYCVSSSMGRSRQIRLRMWRRPTTRTSTPWWNWGAVNRSSYRENGYVGVQLIALNVSSYDLYIIYLAYNIIFCVSVDLF